MSSKAFKQYDLVFSVVMSV